MVTFQIAGESVLQFKVVARSVLFAGSRCGQVKPEICRALIERFRRPGFGFFVGCADGVDAAFRQTLANSECRRDEVFVGCAFARRARRCRAQGLFASMVVPEEIPPQAALARRSLWLVKRSSVVVLFPERPTDSQWGPGSRLVYRSSLRSSGLLGRRQRLLTPRSRLRRAAAAAVAEHQAGASSHPCKLAESDRDLLLHRAAQGADPE